MERMIERKFSGHVCANICPNLYVLLFFLSGSPMCDRDNKLLLCFIKRTRKPKKWDCCKVLGNSTTFLLHCTLSVMRIEKGQGIVDDCPFPCLNTRIHISHSVRGSMGATTWEPGFVSADNHCFCLEQSWDIGIIKNRPAMSEETTKAPLHSHPFYFK